MRQARFLPPRRRSWTRVLPFLGLALTGWGCQQPPYYIYNGYGAPGCVPVVPAPAVPANGNGGEPPTEVIEGGMTAVEAPGRTTTVIGAEALPRVVVGDSNGPSRPAWRRNPDPDQVLPTTEVQGAVRTTDPGDSAVNP